MAVGAILYHLAPPDVAPGHYNANLRIIAPGLSVNEQFDVTLVESGSLSEEIRILNGTSTHAEVKVQSVVVINTGTKFTIKIALDWQEQMQQKTEQEDAEPEETNKEVNSEIEEPTKEDNPKSEVTEDDKTNEDNKIKLKVQEEE